MNLTTFNIKKICTVYRVTNSYYFNSKHNADSYLNSIEQILIFYDLTDEFTLSGYIQRADSFIATFICTNPFGVDIECVINFRSTTLTITVKE